MWNTFKHTLLFLVREKNILIWALAFPLVLATLFNFMFANLDESTKFRPIPTALVADKAYDEDEAFKRAIEAVSAPSADQLLDTSFVATESEARDLLKTEAVEGYITLDDSGNPIYHVSAIVSPNFLFTANRTIVKNFLDSFVQSKELINQLISTDQSALPNLALIESLSSPQSYTSEVKITANDPNPTIRYFYALLGFSTLMAATVGLVAISATLANTSALGARRAVGATSKLTTLTATLAASWLASFCCIMVGYLYIRFVFAIDFGGKEVACIFAIVVSSFVTTALGSMLGAIPKLSEGAKAGILTGVTCFLALFAGLYGEASMQLADVVTRNAPVVQLFNPAKQVADLFYSLYYYETYTQYFEIVGILTITAAVLFVGAALLMRRHRYASL